MSPKRSNPKKAARWAYDPALKAAAIGALISGQSIDQVAKLYELPVGTVKGWKSKLKPDHVATVTGDAKAQIGTLLLDYLRENLTTLRIHQTTVFRDEAWLKKQGASEMAVLHGVITDKAVRLIEAMSSAGLTPEPDA